MSVAEGAWERRVVMMSWAEGGESPGSSAAVVF